MNRTKERCPICCETRMDGWPACPACGHPYPVTDDPDADDMNDPVADTLRGLLDGHVVLSRTIARSRHPAVDIGASVSRLMSRIVSPEHQDASAKVRRMLATYEDAKDLIAIGAYRAGADPKVDKAVRSISEAEALLAQRSGEGRPFQDTVRRLVELAAKAE